MTITWGGQVLRTFLTSSIGVVPTHYLFGAWRGLLNVGISESLATRLEKRRAGPVELKYSVSTRSFNSRRLIPQWDSQMVLLKF